MGEKATTPEQRLEAAESGITKLTDQASELAEKLEHASSKDDRKAVGDITGQIEKLEESLGNLEDNKRKALQDAERKAMSSRITTLQETIDRLREPDTGFVLSGAAEGDETPPIYGQKGTHSFYADVLASIGPSHDVTAQERWQTSLEGKSMTEGISGAAGGFLVPDQISDELVQLRLQDAVLRPLFSSVAVTSDTLQISTVTGGLTAGWVAELAEKPEQDMTFGEITASVFTAAGMATASNQLLRDASSAGNSVDSLVNRDLARRLRTVEEVAFLNGTGSGQPLGVLQTPSVNDVPLTGTTVPELLDAITDGITEIYSNYFGGPSAIVMHPRTWARIVKARESASPTTYIVGPPGGVGRRPQDNLPGYGSGQTPRGELFGVPVYTTANVPTNLGVGTDESAVIVGNFSEGLILDREAITLNQSEHVYFTSNRTVFRAEEALGFTAARYPKAFSVITGVGLADG